MGCPRRGFSAANLPDYPVGTIVVNKISGLRGIVLSWDCGYNPCWYWVRYAVTHATGSSNFYMNKGTGGGSSELGVGLWKNEQSSGIELERYYESPPNMYEEEYTDDIPEWKGDDNE